MSDIKLIIDGKEYICRPVEENDAVESERPRTGYERVNKKQEYYTTYNDFYDDISEENAQEDDENYSVGNYYSDEQFAADIARAETLMRRMRQWQALNDEAVDWTNKDSVKWAIYFDYDSKTFETQDACVYRDLGQIYFSSEEKAEDAAVAFYDDLMWYFTEYQQRLDEPKHK